LKNQTVITSQLPLDKWQEVVGDATFAAGAARK
jgi:hypothetical protein